MAKATEYELMCYVAQCAESIIEDDMNESGDWTEEEHEDLTERAMRWCYEQYSTTMGENRP